MTARRIIIDSRMTIPWSGSHADLKVVNDALSVCFADLRQWERPEWEAAQPKPQASKPEVTALEKLDASVAA